MNIILRKADFTSIEVSVHPLDLWHDSGAAWLCLLRCLCPNQLDGLGTTTAISMGAKWLLFFYVCFWWNLWIQMLFFETFFFLKCPLFHRSRFFWLYSFKFCLVYPSFRWPRYPHHPNQQGFWVKHPWKRSNKSSQPQRSWTLNSVNWVKYPPLDHFYDASFITFYSDTVHKNILDLQIL